MNACERPVDLFLTREQCERASALVRREWDAGITLEAQQVLMAMQGHVCALCGATETERGTFHLDHDHQTNRVRGFLCSVCNQRRLPGYLRRPEEERTDGRYNNYLSADNIPPLYVRDSYGIRGKGKSQTNAPSDGHNHYHAAVLEFAEGLQDLLETEDGADPAFQHFRVSDVAYNSGLDSRSMAIALGELGIPKQPGDTYLSEDLVRALFANVGSTALIGPPPVTTADLCREAVMVFAAQLRHQPHDEWFLPGEIAAAAGLDPRPVGNALSGLGLKRTRDKGYRSGELIRAWEAKQQEAMTV